MSNTVKIPVNKADGWKPILTGVGGAFSASASCRYLFGTTPPAENDVGHRLNGGDLETFVLDAAETMYVKSDADITVSYSVSGVGFKDNWFSLMTIGQKAMSSQSYLEQNCKLGTQWEFSGFEPTLETNGVRYLLFTTRAKPVALKARIYGYDGLGVAVTIYRNPTVTGSTDITNLVSNLNDRNPETLLSTLASVTPAQVSDTGDLWVPSREYLGNSQQGTGIRVRSEINPDLTGLERWFAENTTYLVKTESIDSVNTQRLTQYFTFYEGFPDLP